MDSTADAEAESDATSTSDESITPRKMLWRSASWSAFSSPTSSPTRNQKPVTKPKPDPIRPPKRPGQLALPLRPSLAGWPRQASDDSTSTPAGSLADPDSPDLSRVTHHVYLGSDSAARDRAALRRHGITHVLNCVGSACPDYFRGDGELVYKTLWLHDSPGEDLASILYDAFDFLESAVVAPPPDGGRVLVHCVRGASRSAAVVVAYLMWRHVLPFDAALRRVRAARPVADPNLGFAAQLLRRQQRALGLPASPGSIRRVLRLAPHSPYAPLHLVPKSVLLTNGDPGSFLDSRGAFLIHVPDAIYIWIGARCEPTMAAAALKVARQVVRYERVLAPVVSVNEGSELEEFWAAVSDDLVAPDPSEVGKRRVDIYDLDFEIFQHALKSNSCDEPLESTTPSSSSSADSTFSPASSSSSDWYNSPTTPDRPGLCQTPRVPLGTIKEKESGWILPSTEAVIPNAKTGSLAERRGGMTPLLNLSEQVEAEHEQVMMDWCPSPPFIPDLDEDQHRVDLEKQFPLDPSDESNKAEEEEPGGEKHKKLDLIHPALYRWPELDQVEEIHHDVLDSQSIFLMVAPDSRIGSRKSKGRVLYLWLGTKAKLVGKEKEEWDYWARSIAKDVVDRMGLPRDTLYEIIKEGQEPEQFLNHLFSFH